MLLVAIILYRRQSFLYRCLDSQKVIKFQKACQRTGTWQTVLAAASECDSVVD